MNLRKQLRKDGYSYAKITLLNSMHLCIKANINGAKGLFLLDTGASNSCLDVSKAKKFGVRAKKSKMKAVGAGNSEITTSFSKKNKVTIGKTKFGKTSLVLLDLTHVNGALEQMNSGKVHGVIGADILQSGNAIIDYSKFRLYLKK